MTVKAQVHLWPKTIKVSKKDRTLTINFNDGTTFHYPAEYLRVESPSAEVRGHGVSQRQVVFGCKEVGITLVEPIGNYAIRIHFDDNHNTGIYSWHYLQELGLQYKEKWQRYLALLEGMGLSRS